MAFVTGCRKVCGPGCLRYPRLRECIVLSCSFVFWREWLSGVLATACACFVGFLGFVELVFIRALHGISGSVGSARISG